METILAFDTSQTVLSVALRHNDRLFVRNENTPRAQAQTILTTIDSVLKEAGASMSDVHLICVGAGPGSFTGIRIAVSVAQGLAFSHNIPVLTVSSLACIAQEAVVKSQCKQVLVVIDARMGEVYCGVYQYDEKLQRVVGVDSVLKPEKVCNPFDTSCAIVGDAIGVLPIDVTGERIAYTDSEILPSAEFLINIAQNSEERILASQAHPMYIRDKVVIDSAG